MTAYREIPIASRGRRSHTTELRKYRLDFLGRLGYEKRDIVRAGFWDRYLIFINSPELLQETLIEGQASFQKQLGIRIAFFPLAGEGLTTSEGDLWRRQRKLMAPLFQHNQIAEYVDSFVECATARANQWKNGQVIDLYEEMNAIAMRIAGRTLFDAEALTTADEVGAALNTSILWINDRINSPVMILQLLLIEALQKAGVYLPRSMRHKVDVYIRRLRSPLLLPGAESRKVRAATEFLDRRVQLMIEERRAAGLLRPDLLTKLLKARDEDDGSKMSDKQVRDEILTLFVGGHEGTSATLSYCLYFLCKDPELYRKVEAEADSTENPVTYTGLPKLQWTMMTLKEAMRILPSGYMFGKNAIHDVSVTGGYRIPKNADVFVSPYSLHHRPDLYPDPDRFDPERFTPARESALPKFAYIPFSLGPRICIGNHFALFEGQAVLAALLQRVRFSLEPGEELRPIAATTLRPNPIKIRVTCR